MIEDFHKLYRAAVPFSKLKLQLSEEYRAFKEKRGNPVALASAQKHIDVLPHYESFYKFWQENPIFWLIPIDLPSGFITGYLLRSFKSSTYRLYTPEDSMQLVYGWFDFKEYKKGLPIILTEGAKDREFVGKIYPYTLGLLSSSCSAELLQVLGSMTKRIVLALDNDDTGTRQTASLRKSFKSEGISTISLNPHLKDWGRYFSLDSEKQAEGLKKVQLGLAQFGITLK